MSEPSMPAPPEMGLFARAIGVLTSPRKTFEAVVANPRPVGIVFLVAVIIAAATALPQFTEKGRQATLDMQVQQIEKFTGQPVTDEMYSAMEKRSQYGGYVTAATVFIFTPVVTLFFGAIYWAIFNIVMGGTAAYKQVLAIVAHSSVVSTLGVALGVPIQYLKGSMSATGPFNLGALLPMLDEKSFLANFLGSIDLFRVWSILVTAIGLGVLYKRKTGPIAATLFIIYAVIAGGIAAYLSR